MTEEQINELERLALNATPGPWDYDPTGGFRWCFLEKRHVFEATTDANAAYIVAACNAVPELIARVRELERQNKELIEWNYEFQRESRKLQLQLEQAAKEAGE